MKRNHVGLALGLILIAGSVLQGEEPKGFTTSLFDGKTLAGWHVTGCEAEVDDGTIYLKSGNGLLRTDYRYGDFVLEVEWLALDKTKWDSGIYFRCDLPPEGRPWPRRYQANLLKGQEGNVGGLDGATSKGLVKDNEWNSFKLTVIGTTAALEINGKPAWKADGIEQPVGYIALQAEVPGGGQFKFRNISLTELGYSSLFDGKDYAANWEGAGSDAAACWAVQEGAIVGLKEKGPWLRSKSQYDDFSLRFDYLVESGANSGVYIRVPEDGNHHGKDSGIEVQILDDRHEKYAKLKPYQFCGGLYDFVGPSEKVGLPPGEWNRMEINCQGHSYRITHNGVVIVETNLEQTPALEERLLKGFLGFQNHGGGVAFRNIRLGPALR